MEINDQTLAKLKQKMADALEQERQSMLAFTSMNRASAEDIYQALLADSEKVAETYADFDLNTELDNPDFVILMRAGVPMRRAYEAIHAEHLMEIAFMLGRVYSQNDRPAENGLSHQATAATPGSMANSTRQQRDEIRSRVRRGEKVRL